MATKWIVRLTFLTLALSIFLIGIGIYLLWTQGRALTEANEKIARRSASVLYMDDPIEETITFIAGTKDLLTELCRSASAEIDQTSCAIIKSRSEILLNFNLAALARASATEPAAFERTEQLYRQALARATGPADREWRAYAHEGIAYTLMRRNRLDEAASAISDAQQTGAAPPIVLVTDLKIRCSRGESQQELRQRFDQVRRWGQGAGASDLQAQQRLNRLLTDPELELLCGDTYD